MRKAILLLIGLCVIIVPLTAQSDDWYVGKPIKNIVFKGLENIDESELRGVVKPFLGEEFRDSLYLDLQSKLYALNYFEQFVANAVPGDDDWASVIIEFTVEERPIVDDIAIEGNRNIRNTDILDVILIKIGDMISKTKIRLDAQAIGDLYIERGYPDAQVEWAIEESEEENSAVIVFTIEEGSQTRVSTIQFSGNTFASSATLRRKLETKEQSLFSTGVFQENNIESDIMAIQDYYWERGYIDAEVVDVVREVAYNEDRDRNEMTITFYIEEGVQYTYGGMSFEGNTLFTNEELKELLHLQEGKILNMKTLDADYARVTDLYYNDGYIFNIIEREANKDQENRVVSYTINIVERGRAHIENLIITGTNKTKDYVVYREIPLEPGDIFSKDKVIEGIQNLYNTGYFTSVVPETPFGSAEGLMDLVFNLEEGKTTDINFGITFAGNTGAFPLIGFLKWTDHNFLGNGQEMSVGAEASALDQSIEFSFTEKWLAGRRWSLGGDFSFEHSLVQNVYQDILFPTNKGVPDPFDGHYVFSEDDTEYDSSTFDAGDPFPGIPSDDDIDEYNLVTDYRYAIQSGQSIPDSYKMEYHSFDFSLGVNTGYTHHSRVGRWGVGTGFRSSLGYVFYDETLFRPFDRAVMDNWRTWKFTNRLWVNLSWDNRDFVYNPTKGYYIGQSFTYTGGFLGGERDYIKSMTKADGFLTLVNVPVAEIWSFKLVLAAHTAFSMVLPQFSKTESGEWDWERDTTSEDLLYTDGMMVARGWPTRTYGEAMWDNWLEIRMPIVEQYLWFDLFFSMTGFWQDFSKLSSMHIDDYLFSFGGGLRLTIPGLPIGFYLAKRFKTVDGQVQWQRGNIFANEERESSGIDFVISFTYQLY
jgi:outer membrane protein insertion porin family